MTSRHTIVRRVNSPGCGSPRRRKLVANARSKPRARAGDGLEREFKFFKQFGAGPLQIGAHARPKSPRAGGDRRVLTSSRGGGKASLRQREFSRSSAEL